MDPHIPPKGPEPVVSTLSRSSEATTFSWLPFTIGAFVLAVLGSIVVLVQFTSVAAQEEETSQALAEQQGIYEAKADIVTQVREVGALAAALATAYGEQVPYKEVLDIIEQTSYKQATYDLVSIKSGGVVSLSGTVGRYGDFAQLVKALKDTDTTDGITTNVVISSVGQSLVTESVGETTTEAIKTKFSVTFTIKPELFVTPAKFNGYAPTPAIIESEPAVEETEPAINESETVLPETSSSATDTGASADTADTGVDATSTGVDEADLTDIFNQATGNPPTNEPL